MAERVHSHNDSPPTPAESPQWRSRESDVQHKPQSPTPDKPAPQPGTYVIQIPKDQVYRVPPPENARRYQQYTRGKSQRRTCLCCCCWFLSSVISLIVLLAITCGVLYLVFKPKSPDYTINSIAVRGLNLTSSATEILPKFDVNVRADNPNKKIGIYYEIDSSVEVYYKAVRLCGGALPVFYQRPRNVTMFNTALTGSKIELTIEESQSLLDAQSKGRVPLIVNLRAPVKIKFGSVKTWKITVKFDCDITVDKLTNDAKIFSKQCNYKVNLW